MKGAAPALLGKHQEEVRTHTGANCRERDGRQGPGSEQQTRGPSEQWGPATAWLPAPLTTWLSAAERSTSPEKYPDITFPTGLPDRAPARHSVFNSKL